MTAVQSPVSPVSTMPYMVPVDSVPSVPSVCTTLSSTASCLSSVLLNNDEWCTNNAMKCEHYDEFCPSGNQLVTEADDMCGISLLDSCEVATTLARLEESAMESDWSEDRASIDGSEHNYQTMHSVPFNYLSDLNQDDDQYMTENDLIESPLTSPNSSLPGHTYRRTSWSDSDDSYEVEVDESKVPIHIRTINLSTEEDSGESSSNESIICQKPKFSSRKSCQRKIDLTKCKTSRSRRGRPPTFCKSGYRASQKTLKPAGRNRVPKDILLWKFILDALRNPDCTFLQWENERLGTFKFVDTVECSRRWGLLKMKDNNNTMTFEKLSRSIRYYYKDGLMRRDGLRLVYKINWDKVPVEYCPR